MSEPLYKQCFLNLSICLIIVLGSKYVLMAKVGKADMTVFVSCKRPASVRKDEKATSLLSHLETRGQKSATVGLVILRGNIFQVVFWVFFITKG